MGTSDFLCSTRQYFLFFTSVPKKCLKCLKSAKNAYFLGSKTPKSQTMSCTVGKKILGYQNFHGQIDGKNFIWTQLPKKYLKCLKSAKKALNAINSNFSNILPINPELLIPQWGKKYGDLRNFVVYEMVYFFFYLGA